MYYNFRCETCNFCCHGKLGERSHILSKLHQSNEEAIRTNRREDVKEYVRPNITKWVHEGKKYSLKQYCEITGRPYFRNYYAKFLKGVRNFDLKDAVFN
jgi:hypothetical protein